jgi:hypothetical protein
MVMGDREMTASDIPTLDHASRYIQSASLTRGQLLDLMLDAEFKLKTYVRVVLKRQQEDGEKLIPSNIRKALQEIADKAPRSSPQQLGAWPPAEH